MPEPEEKLDLPDCGVSNFDNSDSTQNKIVAKGARNERYDITPNTASCNDLFGELKEDNEKDISTNSIQEADTPSYDIAGLI